MFINITPNFWDACVTFLQLPELIIDSRFETNASWLIAMSYIYYSEAIANVIKKSLGPERPSVGFLLGVVMTFEEVLRIHTCLPETLAEPIVGRQGLRMPDIPALTK